MELSGFERLESVVEHGNPGVSERPYAWAASVCKPSTRTGTDTAASMALGAPPSSHPLSFGLASEIALEKPL